MNDTNIKFYEELQKMRVSKSMTLKEISEYTKINISYLEALEEGNFTVLPNVYTRLFLRSYCEYIGADYKEYLDKYEIHTLGEENKVQKIKNPEQINESDINQFSESSEKLLAKSKDYKELAVAATVVLIIIILFIIISTFN